MIYNIPFRSSSKILSGVISGWQLSNIPTLESGQWVTPLWTGLNPTGTRPVTGAATARATVTLRPDILRDPKLSNPSVSRWFDPFAFAAPGPGRFGTQGRGILEGPGYQHLARQHLEDLCRKGTHSSASGGPGDQPVQQAKLTEPDSEYHRGAEPERQPG